ncbi:hypothetical protein [Bdellovibrio bacteriovorus]|uniref:hypothetical protein n=1 Tax=Bdellovibrio bacteriovorus TaxID=959 RepID=UPI0035A5F254
MKLAVRVSAILLLSLSAQAQSKDAATQWRVTQPAWTEYHEEQFGQFVARLGDAVEKRQCGKVNTCMLSTANMYYGTDPSGLKYYSDCADLPYYLRGYFAWKNGLPFSVTAEVKPSPLNTDKVKDVRYSSQGNMVTKRYDVLTKNGIFKNTYPNALEILNDVVPGLTYSATLRMSGSEDAELYTDFYPVKIDRQGIRPGTVIYDPNGHVAVVYKVTDDGRVFYIDAHPDNSLTMGMFTPKFVRSNPNQGAGFKNSALCRWLMQNRIHLAPMLAAKSWRQITTNCVTTVWSSSMELNQTVPAGAKASSCSAVSKSLITIISA